MPIEKLIQAADNHAEDSGEDHNVGDLQDMLRAAWELLTPGQRLKFLQSDAVENVVELGARSEFEVDELIDELKLPAHVEGGTRMLVVCTDSNGAPAIFPTELVATSEQLEMGDHYDMAEVAAAADGYEGPFIAIDPTDPAARTLLSAHDWVTA